LVPVVCLGTTKAGHPKHPLYLPRSAAMVPWEGSRPAGTARASAAIADVLAAAERHTSTPEADRA
ncbi:MAG TPA: hypothetical protein VM328_10925, partial [Fimbriimonadaceae bacterium]|nr:hypothetical protein [Fimbriimonadaceae bacterium]